MCTRGAFKGDQELEQSDSGRAQLPRQNSSLLRNFELNTIQRLHRIQRQLHCGTQVSQGPRRSLARLRSRTSDHGTVFAFPESNSLIRLSISSSQAACTSLSTFPPRFEISDSAKASCSAMDKERAFSSSLETSVVI